MLVLLFLPACQSKTLSKASDALWNIISEQCLPNQLQNNKPAPCNKVSFVNEGQKQGFVVFKDRNGPLQYLLMPIEKISGVESPELLSSQGPNYFYEAWLARSFMIQKYGANIPDEEISLAVNSQTGRSQNQLHIHISCVRAEVKKLIHENFKTIKKNWTQFNKQISGHNYFVKLISEAELKNKNIFSLVSAELIEAKNNMNQFGLALVAVKKTKKQTEFVVLATRADLLKINYGSAEEIQDHSCPELFKNNN